MQCLRCKKEVREARYIRNGYVICDAPSCNGWVCTVATWEREHHSDVKKETVDGVLCWFSNGEKTYACLTTPEFAKKYNLQRVTW